MENWDENSDDDDGDDDNDDEDDGDDDDDDDEGDGFDKSHVLKVNWYILVLLIPLPASQISGATCVWAFGHTLCSPLVGCSSCDQEVVGLNPDGLYLF